MPKYPDIHIQLTGRDGNVFFILGVCMQAMRRAKLPKEEQDKFYAEATSGSYDDVLVTCMRWFDVE